MPSITMPLVIGHYGHVTVCMSEIIGYHWSKCSRQQLGTQ